MGNKGTECDWFRNHGWDQRAMIQMNSLESQTDMREHQALALSSASDSEVSWWTTMETPPSPSQGSGSEHQGQVHTPGCPSEPMRCICSNPMKTAFLTFINRGADAYMVPDWYNEGHHPTTGPQRTSQNTQPSTSLSGTCVPLVGQGMSLGGTLVY